MTEDLKPVSTPVVHRRVTCTRACIPSPEQVPEFVFRPIVNEPNVEMLKGHYQRQKSFAVKKAKFRGTAKCRNAEFRGSFAVKICNFGSFRGKNPVFAVLSQ